MTETPNTAPPTADEIKVHIALREAQNISRDAENLRRSLQSLVLEAQDALKALDEGRPPQSLDFALFGQTIWKNIPEAAFSLRTRLTSAIFVTEDLVKRALSERGRFSAGHFFTEAQAKAYAEGVLARWLARHGLTWAE
jgi:hypothetical protein